MSVHHKDLIMMTREAQSLCKELEDLQKDEHAEGKLADVEAKLIKLDTERTKRNYVEHDGVIEIGLPDLLQSLDKCFQVLKEIKSKPVSLEKELHQIKKDLIRLRDTPSKELTMQDVVPYHQRLRELEMKKVDGKFLRDAVGTMPSHQAALNKLLAECQQLKEDLMNKLK